MGNLLLNELEAMEFLKERLTTYNYVHMPGDQIVFEREKEGTWHGYCNIHAKPSEVVKERTHEMEDNIGGLVKVRYDGVVELGSPEKGLANAVSYLKRVLYDSDGKDVSIRIRRY